MSNCKALLLALVCVLAIAAPPPAKVPLPPLEPGEALALTGPDGVVHRFGPAQVEGPMGGLACLAWLKLEGAEWGASVLAYRCTGSAHGLSCSLPKGHGRVDLPKAMAVGCDLAFLTWANQSGVGWRNDYGEGAARARLEDAFGPFLGNRMPAGEDLPVLNGAWIGAGALLRTSPDALLTWLLDPAQDETVRRVRRLTLSFVQETFQTAAWWVLTATAEVPGEPGKTCAWAVGGNGTLLAVLRLPSGQGRAQALARFRAVLFLPGK